MDHNRDLEDEVDRFMTSDNEIRNKLGDRNCSPLRLHDLYRGANEESNRIVERIKSK